ncbi:primase alpha helix C-terminal domain-containing protein, partial [Streptomyces caniscabiei]|nr:primase alpha helix C-terminal domain-containing protein [Streptomyces caniscabiei]
LHPAPCPPALLRLLLPPPRTDSSRTPGGASRTPGGGAFTTPGGAQGSGHGLVHFVLTAQEGQRNTRLFWAACRAYENGLGPELANALVEVAVRTGLTEREARSTIASAARMARGGR